MEGTQREGVVQRKSAAPRVDGAPPRLPIVAPPDIGNLRATMDDVRLAALDMDQGPEEPTEFFDLRGRLEASRHKLPPIYRETACDPYVATLDRLGTSGFTSILVRDPQREGVAGLMLDIAQAILQNGEGYQDRATDAFQEVVTDLYDGFLSAEDRRGINPPDEGTLPPLVKWGNPDFGPYTWTGDSTRNFGVGCAVVNLPPANARRGLLAWAALGHETGGHDIIHADHGLEAQLTDAVFNALRNEKLDDFAEYWSERIDETASDVLGILNMGPAAAIGIVGYFRGLNWAFGGRPVLRNNGPASDPHPADILRGYLGAATVGLLRFDGAQQWARVIEDETAKDANPTIELAGNTVSIDQAKRSAQIVERTLVKTPMPSLEMHALGQIQNWWNHDEKIVADLRETLTSAVPVSSGLASGVFAAHAVAAAVTSALADGSDATQLFDRMLALLKLMHDRNASWGPLFVRHPGDVARDVVYLRA